MGLVEDQVDAMIAQRVSMEGRGSDEITSSFAAAQSLVVDLGPATCDDSDDKLTARTYLSRLLDELPAS